ncbi:MAG TPA: hypothetical protein VKA87_09140 [Nitrososphaeraceae archaeon]|nr:hypothetical protein [Nitrososphaeraceae archaeon]
MEQTSPPITLDDGRTVGLSTSMRPGIINVTSNNIGANAITVADDDAINNNNTNYDVVGATLLHLTLSDLSDNETTIKHVSYRITAKDAYGNLLFKDLLFHSHGGGLDLNITQPFLSYLTHGTVSTSNDTLAIAGTNDDTEMQELTRGKEEDSNENKNDNNTNNFVVLTGKKDPASGEWMAENAKDIATDGNERIDIQAPWFVHAGLYNFEITILGMDTDKDRPLENPLVFKAQIVRGGATDNTVNFRGQLYNVTVVSYYDSINDFLFNPDTKTFSWSIPFDWTNLEQVITSDDNDSNTKNSNANAEALVVHQELIIPKMLIAQALTTGSTTQIPSSDNTSSTKNAPGTTPFDDIFSSTSSYSPNLFSSTVEGFGLMSYAIIIDPFSFKDKMTIHYIINNPTLVEIAKAHSQQELQEEDQQLPAQDYDQNHDFDKSKEDAATRIEGQSINEKMSFAFKMDTSNSSINDIEHAIQTSELITNTSRLRIITTWQPDPLAESTSASDDTSATTTSSKSPFTLNVTFYELLGSDIPLWTSLHNADVRYNLAIMNSTGSEIESRENLIATNATDSQIILLDNNNMNDASQGDEGSRNDMNPDYAFSVVELDVTGIKRPGQVQKGQQWSPSHNGGATGPISSLLLSSID